MFEADAEDSPPALPDTVIVVVLSAPVLDMSIMIAAGYKESPRLIMSAKERK